MLTSAANPKSPNNLLQLFMMSADAKKCRRWLPDVPASIQTPFSVYDKSFQTSRRQLD
jgi:hypothetical protein